MFVRLRYFLLRYKLYIFSVLGILLCLFLYGKSMEISNTRITDQYNNLWSTNFDTFYSNKKDAYIYNFDLWLAFSKDRRILINPNDCISKVLINGAEYQFNEKEDLCDVDNGVPIDLWAYSLIGKNYISVYMQQRWHGRNIVLSVDGRDNIQFLLFAIMTWLLWVMIMGMIFATNIPKNYKIILSILFAIVLWFSYTYFTQSFYTKWTHDVFWHMSYIKIVVSGDLLPSASTCWVCYHPPVYYFLSAIVYKISQLFYILNPYIVVRRFGIILYSIGLFFGVRFIYVAFQKKPIAFWCSVLLLLFWPLNYYYGPRIINDNLFYMFSFIFLYLLILRYKKGSKIFEDNKNIVIWTFVVLILWLFTKSNFIIRLPLLFITTYRSFSLWDGNKWLFKESLINNIKKWYIYYIYCLAILFWYIAFQAIFKSTEIVWNISIFGLVGYIWDVDLFKTFTSFDYDSFISNTRWRWNQSLDESEYFWNYLFKSMLYSETWVYDDTKVFFAKRMNLVFLFFILTTFVKVFISDKKKLFYLIWFIIPIVAIIIYRINYPYIAAMNYRYIHPHILFFLYYMCSDINLNNLKNFKFVSYIEILLIVILIWIFIILSLPPYL